MGIRVHKCLGYGVPNLRTRKGKYHRVACDPVFNTSAFHKFRDEERDEEFLPYLLEHRDRLRQLSQRERPGVDAEWDVKFVLGDLKQLKHINLNHALIHREECGMASVALVVPPTCPDWYRFDTTLDWVEESTVHQAQNRVLRLDEGSSSNAGIYPYSGPMRRFRDPAPGLWTMMGDRGSRAVDDLGPLLLEGGEYNRLVGKWDRKLPPLVKDKTLLKHLRQDWRAYVPTAALAVLVFYEQSGCFPPAAGGLEAFIDRMRPLLYVYWG